MHITSLPAAPTVAPGARPHRLKPLTLALAVALGMTAASPALPNITWTGNAPVYTASWYNGVYTEFHEFQYFLDWQLLQRPHRRQLRQRDFLGRALQLGPEPPAYRDR